jgi:hypothetical protein
MNPGHEQILEEGTGGQEMGLGGGSKGVESVHGVKDDLFYWTVGIAMLFFALVVSSFLGHLQSYGMFSFPSLSLFLSLSLLLSPPTGYARWGRHSEEAKFYTHFLSLFGFFFAAGDIVHRFNMWATSPNLVIPVLEVDTGVPEMWVWVSLNVVTQYP